MSGAETRRAGRRRCGRRRDRATVALGPRIDIEFQWSVRRFVGVLDQGLKRKNASAAHVDRQSIERRVNRAWRGKRASGSALATSTMEGPWIGGGIFSPSPEVEPIVPGDRRPRSRLPSRRTAEARSAVGPRRNSVSRLPNPGVGRRENFRELEEYRPHQGKPGAGSLFGQSVDVRQQPVACLDVAAADRFVARGRGPRFRAADCLLSA